MLKHESSDTLWRLVTLAVRVFYRVDRQGIAVALNYLSRVYFPDPSDVLPDPPNDSP